MAPVGDGDPGVSGETEAPDADGAFAKRQADAVFTVVGDAPGWALKWTGNGD